MGRGRRFKNTWYGFKEPVDYCSETGKVCYDKIGAQTAANHRFEEEHKRLRIYACPFCQSQHREKVWHLTHQKAETFYRTNRKRGMEDEL